MNPNNMIRYRRDLFVASRNPFAARWSTLPTLAFAQTSETTSVATASDDAEPDEDEDDEDLDEEFDDEDSSEEEEEEDEDDRDAEQTAEPDGQFPDAPDPLTDTERPGAPQNRHGDRGGVS